MIIILNMIIITRMCGDLSLDKQTTISRTNMNPTTEEILPEKVFCVLLVFYSSHFSFFSKGVRLEIFKFWVSNPKFQVLEMYNMLLEISTELDSIKAMLQKSGCTHFLDFQIFCYRQTRQ